MADLSNTEKLKALFDAYGIAVRAGALTPCLQDENDFRELMGLRPAPAEVTADWKSSGGVRRPVTLMKPSEAEESQSGKAAPGAENDQENNNEV